MNEGVVPAAEPKDQAGVAGLSDAAVVAGVDVGVPSEGCLSLVRKSMSTRMYKGMKPDRILTPWNEWKKQLCKTMFFAYNKNLPSYALARFSSKGAFSVST